MQSIHNKGFSNLGQFGMLLLFFGLGLMLASILQWIILFPLMPKGTDLSNFSDALQTMMKNPAQVNVFRWLQFLSTACVFLLPALAYAFVCKKKPMEALGFNLRISIFQILIGFLLIFTANLLADPLQQLSKQLLEQWPSINRLASSMEKAYEDQVQLLATMHHAWEWMLALVIMALLPALFEEIFFRGALQQILSDWWKSPLMAVLVASIVFSLIHSSIYLFFSRALLGFVLGWMYHRTKNIWINIIAHFLNNALALGMMYAASQSKRTPTLQDTEFNVDTWLAILAALALIGLFRLLDRYTDAIRIKNPMR